MLWADLPRQNVFLNLRMQVFERAEVWANLADYQSQSVTHLALFSLACLPVAGNVRVRLNQCVPKISRKSLSGCLALDAALALASSQLPDRGVERWLLSNPLLTAG